MRQREVALLLTLGLVVAGVPALALPTPPSGPFLPHAPIVITADAHFNASNGVVAGTGAPGDPFVIRGWSFVTSGTAIRIENVTAAFIVIENAFDAGVGVHLARTTQVGVVQNNQFIVRTTGVLVVNADAHVRDNSFIGQQSGSATGRGVVLVTSNSVVESNAFMYLQFGVYAERGSPQVVCNDMHDDVIYAGVYATLTTNATISCNIITQCTFGIKVDATIGTIVANNTVTSCYGGIEVKLSKDATVANNTISVTLGAQLTIHTVSGNVTGNVVIGGRAEGVIIVNSPVVFANNTVHNNIGVGVSVTGTADLAANVVSHNSVGIQLVAGAIVNLTANVMSNNSIGIDIPYESRQTIVNMSANIVNGVNIDGSINASQRVYFYKQANVTIIGQVRDSGFSAGFYGSLTAQGGIVLYEVNTVNVNASVIAHHTVGVGIVNSFNVNVNRSLVVSNTIGIRAEARAGVGVVPPCVVSVKNVNITIPVDPVATVGVDLGSGCLGILANVSVSVVDVGIRLGAAAGVTLTNSTFFDTKVGADIQGTPNMTNVSGNAFVNNRVGVRLSGTIGVFRNNTVQNNAEVGVRLENSAQLLFEGNNVSYNGVGVLDAEVCAGALTCSTLNARHNAFVANRDDGVRLNGYATLRGDVALGNEGTGLVLNGGATLNGVNASGNEEDGVRISGTFDVDDSTFFGNDEDGLDIVGNGELTDSAMIGNEGAGLRVRATSVSALRLNISYNFDGIALNDATAGLLTPNPPPPSVPGLASLLWSLPGGGATPLEIHRSALIRNERDAIRGGDSVVDASHNYFGRPEGPSVNIADTIGAFQNGVTPGVRFLPYYVDPAMTTTGPLPIL